MKLVVVHEDGRTETISISGRWDISEGDYLNRIRDASGFEHFFTHDGNYDGWGAAVNVTPETAEVIVGMMEEKRQSKID